MPKERIQLQDIPGLLSAYDTADLLTAVAALQLMPENADRAGRIDFLAHVAASILESTDKPHISAGALRRICNSSAVRDSLIGQYEDPCDNCFTEAFPFHGGSFVVLTGFVEEPTFILRHLLDAIIKEVEPFGDERFVRQVLPIVSFVLSVSDEIARRAGLVRGVAPQSSPAKLATIPNVARLRDLQQAVTFSESEVADLLRRCDCPDGLFHRMVADAGQISLTDYQPSNGQLHVRPFIRTRKGIVVSLPGVLLATLRHVIVCLASECGVRQQLAERYNSAVSRSIIRTLDMFDNRCLAMSTPQPLGATAIFSEGVFRLDTDKALHVLLVTDALSHYSESDAFGRWPHDGVKEAIDLKLRHAEEQLFQKNPGPNEVLLLVLIQTVGRWIVLGWNRPTGPASSRFLSMSAADLECIGFLEAGDSLALWKYARAASSVRNNTRIQASSELDEFFWYRKHDHCYYFSDDSRPDLISFHPGYAGELRREVQRQLDYHAVPSHEAGYIVEVCRLNKDEGIPIYVEKNGVGRRVALYVSEMEVPVWVTGPTQPTEEEHRLHREYALLAEGIAYWIWQMTPSLRPILSGLENREEPLVIRLHLPPGEGWETKLPDEVSSSDADDLQVTSRGRRLSLTAFSSIMLRFVGTDNDGERYVMAKVLAGLRTLLPPCVGAQLSDQAIMGIINRHMPLGLKKKILVFTESPELDSRGLPPYRGLSGTDCSELLDELGDHLRQNEDMTIGPIADAERTAVLGKAVTFFYRELGKLVASIRPDGLLEWLVARNEAAVRRSRFEQVVTPTRLACYSSEPKMIDEIVKQYPNRADVALSNRFLIEYVAAQPPRGFRRISLGVYDRMVALSHLIISYGIESDMIKYELADYGFKILPSGRLGASRDENQRALDAFRKIFAAGEIRRATKSVDRHFAMQRKEPSKPDLIDQMDPATRIEFGYAASELLDLVREAREIGEDISHVVCSLPRDEFVNRLSNRLGWPKEKVLNMVESLSFGPRAEFLIPPQPFRKEDTYPWRFNRGLSYVRRPFLLRIREGVEEILWGPRHLFNAAGYFVWLCAGRLKAQSKEMRQLMGEFHRRDGEAFNDSVADLFEQHVCLTVRRRVKKVGKLRGAAGLPGEIDVLVADPTRCVLLVIECKDLSVARMPHELRNELIEFFIGEHGKKSFIHKHHQKVAWVRANLSAVLELMNHAPSPKSKWRVEDMLVVDQELLTPFLVESNSRVIPFGELATQLRQHGWLATSRNKSIQPKRPATKLRARRARRR